MLRGLEQANIRFVVIKGVAATLHGSVRITDDLDLCYDTTADNLGALAALLTEWRAYLRGAPPDLPFTLDARAINPQG